MANPDIVDMLRRIAGDTPPGHSVMANVNRVREAIEEITRLRSLTTWRPIAEAPKDGPSLLVRKNGSMSVDHWLWYCIHNQPKFTHFLPLPPPPERGDGQ